MIWKEAQIEEKHEGNGLLYSQTRPLKQKIRVDQSVINLFSPVLSQGNGDFSLL